MDIEAAEWDDWEDRFRQLADKAELVSGSDAQKVKGTAHYLCLYGDNGLSPQEEFDELAFMAQEHGRLKKVEVETSYWQDTVLFIP